MLKNNLKIMILPRKYERSSKRSEKNLATKKGVKTLVKRFLAIALFEHSAITEKNSAK